MQSNRSGFTLVEVLIVVLIIAILSAVAVPQYQKAVMKSRYSALMPIAKSLANGNEAYYMDKGQYATSPTELDVSGQDEKYPDGTKVDMSSGEYSYVLAKRDNLPLNYLVYQKHSEKFADNIHCEADENNTMAQEVCQGLGGELISGSQTEGYLTYVLSGMVGVNDKLPSSLTKLQSSVCEGKTGCTADIIGNQVVSHQCNSSAKQCVDTTYNANGDEVKKLTTQCNKNKAYAKWENDKCIPVLGSPDMANSYIEVKDENNLRVLDRFCNNLSGETCTIERVVRAVYNPDGTVTRIERYCEGVHEDGTCDVYRGSPYDTSYDEEYGVGREWTYLSISDAVSGMNSTVARCAQVDSETGECIRYK